MKENLINVQMSEEFYNEKFLKMGGGNSGGGNENTYEYIDVRELGLESKAPLAVYALAVRTNGYTLPIAQFLIEDDNLEALIGRVDAVMLDLSFAMDLDYGKIETRDFFSTRVGIDISSLPHLTKEEFYNLS